MQVHVILSLLFLTSSVLAQSSFEELLSCNLYKTPIAQHCDAHKELEIYDQLLATNAFYEPQPSLESWIEPGFDYNACINPLHRIVLDEVKQLPLAQVCEVGAGAGKISKYIYHENPHLNITCVELNQKHIDQMIENFQTRTSVINPNTVVTATIINDSFPHLDKVPSESYDLVFTHKIMMHLPFIVAVKSAENLVRISKRYIMHIENKNQGGDWYSMTIICPSAMSSANAVGVDYCSLYEKLGVKTLKYYEVKDPESLATYVVYLGEKINS